MKADRKYGKARIKKEFGDRRFQERLEWAMGPQSQQQITQALGLGESTLSNYLTGKSNPDLPMLRALAQIMGVSLGWLVTGEGSPARWRRETSSREGAPVRSSERTAEGLGAESLGAGSSGAGSLDAGSLGAAQVEPDVLMVPLYRAEALARGTGSAGEAVSGASDSELVASDLGVPDPVAPDLGASGVPALETRGVQTHELWPMAARADFQQGLGLREPAAQEVDPQASDWPASDWRAQLEGWYPLSRRELRSRGVQTRLLAMVRVRDDAMEPTLCAGQLILLDRAAALEPLVDGVFAIRWRRALLIKRLQLLPAGGLRVISDNRRYPSVELSVVRRTEDFGEDFGVVGRLLSVIKDF